MSERLFDPPEPPGIASAGLLEIVHELMAVTARHDRATAMHGARVVRLARRVGSALGLRGASLRHLTLVALLHDIGTSRVPRSILDKPGPLTGAEWLKIHRHPIYGAQMAAGRPETAHLAPAIRASHERFDGDHLDEGTGGQRAELRPAGALDLADGGRLGDRRAVGAVGDHRVVGVAGEADPAGQGYVLAAQAVGVALVSPPWRMLGPPRRPVRVA